MNKKPTTYRYIGRQETGDDRPATPLYNIVGPEKHPRHQSTIVKFEKDKDIRFIPWG